ncbi:MAG: Guanylate kinase [Firmicutes bacterium ADurb.Bin456]|nr:MAG: Guanylate kinase [Firmicutes bacterium ADurb.Bin456]
MGKQGILLVFSGPSGVGKGSICRALLRENPAMHLSVSATTRLPRNGEVHGVDYYFHDDETFKKMIKGNELLEWAEVYGHLYGTPRKSLQGILDQGDDVILEIDIQGALQVKKQFPLAVLIFVLPPSRLALESRLRARGADSREEIGKRLRCITGELEMACRYDYIVVNDEVERALNTVRAIIIAEKARSLRNICAVEDLGC